MAYVFILKFITKTKTERSSFTMRAIILLFLIFFFDFRECSHTFVGTSVMRPLVYKTNATYSALTFRKRIEFMNYTIPKSGNSVIQGILAYDRTHSGATANITEGGIGYNKVKIRMKSDRGNEINYEIYIYA
ncbi:uncharacterized protein LOC101746950 [Bombyx mori]|uniref:Uncharacterized protein n=1 Tax=Bombyx mori TaxID=7091 RepID=A0A8R2AVF7_BOMMO|nr:uncharacterized protein LOC101746950 [Bombyx mori]